MKFFRVAFLLSVVFYAAFPQQRERVLKRAQSLSPLAVSPRVALQDTIRVLALMVEFKVDSDSRTSGNGTFLSSGSSQQIDPPPHDASYFVNKLRFLENYFRKTSNGQVIIRADLFGSTVTLADSVGAYSPPRAGPNSPLARLAVDSWTAANALSPSFPFSQYDAFIIFHAGVGRDIDLISIFGFDPTPNDIPSVTLNLRSMKELLNDPLFQGVPVNSGSFFITNSMIIPETETRVFVSGSRSDTLQLGINGLLAASFGSFLGLPDLFDTRTGRSGIGQFGLMDGASIFAYNGLFPPEPSAWEKAFLNWTVPIVVPPGVSVVSLPAVGLTAAGNDTIYKIPITEREYFLVENRSRDPLGDGQRLSLIQNGTLITRHYARDSIGFFFNDISGIVGSLIDVEDFDWAISGDLTLSGYEGGGVLIWHVDEEVIEAGLISNSVNADPRRRGVDLEEADGSQDIGVAYEFLQPGSGTENGWPLDAWFAGNPAPVYRNAFDAASIPSSASNAGAQSFISIRGFGQKLPRATATVERGIGAFRPASLTRSFGVSSVLSAPTITASSVFVPSDGRVFVFQRNGLSKTPDSTGLLSAVGGQFPLAVFDSIRTFAAGVQDSTLWLWRLADNTADGVFDSVDVQSFVLPARVTTPPMIIDSAGTPLIVVGDGSGRIWKTDFTGAVRHSRVIGANAITRLARGETADGSVIVTAGGSLVVGQNETLLGGSGPWLLAAGRSTAETVIAVAEEKGNIVAAYTPSGMERFRTSVTDSVSELVVSDVDGDGNPDVIVVARSLLYAFNYTGTMLDHYPKKLSGTNVFSGTPLVLDIDANGDPEVLCLTLQGTMVAYTRNGRVLSSFPFQAAPGGKSSTAVYESGSGNLGFLVAGASGALQAWESAVSFGSLAKQWSGFLNNSRHSNFFDGSGFAQIPLSTQFLPKERVYNWPNPVYGSITRIRYYTSQPATISVRIFDVAGASITELKGESAGGIDGELIWDVTNIQSGIYLARVEAAGTGKKESVFMKIAVVK